MASSLIHIWFPWHTPGAYTSSLGLAAAVEAINNNPSITTGHAVAYPIGVIIVILFIDFALAVLRIDVKIDVKKEGKHMLLKGQVRL
jgi:Predicted Permease Membrane Region.